MTKPLPTIEQFCEKLARALVDTPTPRTAAKINRIIKFKEHLRVQDRRLLAGALRGLAKRAEQYAAKVEG
jgi:hypothetical protein